MPPEQSMPAVSGLQFGFGLGFEQSFERRSVRVRVGVRVRDRPDPPEQFMPKVFRRTRLLPRLELGLGYEVPHPLMILGVRVRGFAPPHDGTAHRRASPAVWRYSAGVGIKGVARWITEVEPTSKSMPHRENRPV